MSETAHSDFRRQLRVSLGAALHGLGLYRWLVPFRSQSGELRRRLQAYLGHFYADQAAIEGTLQPTLEGLRFCCNLRDHMIEPYVLGRDSIYEHKEIHYFLSQVRQDDHILDIGANHGFWGFSLAARAATGQLHLVEANPTLVQRLRRTAALNPQIKATIHPVALNDGSSEKIRFFTPPGQLSGLGSIVAHRYALEHGYLDESRYLEVPALSLDRLVQESSIERVDLLKIDVEQGEDLILAGGQEALGKLLPRLIMVETSASSEISRWLIARGYEAFLLDEQSQEQSLRDEGFWGNILFRR